MFCIFEVTAAHIQACKLALVIGHLSGKFAVLTGECQVWADMLTELSGYDVKYKNIFSFKKGKRESELLI